MDGDIEKRTRQYVQIRDLIRSVEDKHKKELAPLHELKEQLAGIIQKFMDDHNLDSLRTEGGTCYKSTRYTASLADPAAFMQYVISTGNFDLLDRRANPTAVRAFVEEHKELPPGCNLNAISNLGVRRKGSTAGSSDD